MRYPNVAPRPDGGTCTDPPIKLPKPPTWPRPPVWPEPYYPYPQSPY